MSFRGRGGRGRGGRGRVSSFDLRVAKKKPFILFPEDVNLPSVPKDSLPDQKFLLNYQLKLESFWKGSCYHLEAAPKSKSRDKELERFCDKVKQRTQAKREALSFYLKLTSSNFPPELIQGSKRVQHDQKKLRWDRDSGEKLDWLEKLDEKYKGQDEMGGKEKKNDSEGEEEDIAEEADEESSDDGDYNQNVDFDDDEDDLNQVEEEEEDTYD